MRRVLGTGILLVSASMAIASPSTTQYDACFRHAGAKFGVDPRLLKAVAIVESGIRPSAIGRNRTSNDYGVMQINSAHLKWLSRYGIGAKRLLNDPCLNIAVGAMILKDNIRRYGYSWVAVGAYNAGRYTAKRRHLHIRYAHRVMRAYEKTRVHP